MAMLKVKTENQMANPVPPDGYVFAFVVQNGDGSCAVKVKLPDGTILTVSGETGPQGPQGKALTFADLTDAQKAALKGEKGDTGGSFLIQVVSSLPSSPAANVLYLIPEE